MRYRRRCIHRHVGGNAKHATMVMRLPVDQEMKQAELKLTYIGTYWCHTTLVPSHPRFHPKRPSWWKKSCMQWRPRTYKNMLQYSTFLNARQKGRILGQSRWTRKHWRDGWRTWSHRHLEANFPDLYMRSEWGAMELSRALHISWWAVLREKI